MVRQGLGCGALLVSVFAGLVSVAHAGDLKVVPGTVCQQFPRAMVAPAQWSMGGLPQAPGAPFNTTGDPIQVVCPLQRDNVGTTSGLVSVRVRGYTPNISKKLICAVHLLHSITGQSVASSPTLQSSAQGYVTLDWGPLFNRVSGMDAESNYQVICIVPAGGSVTSIRYDENNNP